MKPFDPWDKFSGKVKKLTDKHKKKRSVNSRQQKHSRLEF